MESASFRLAQIPIPVYERLMQTSGTGIGPVSWEGMSEGDRESQGAPQTGGGCA